MASISEAEAQYLLPFRRLHAMKTVAFVAPSSSGGVSLQRAMIRALQQNPATRSYS